MAQGLLLGRGGTSDVCGDVLMIGPFIIKGQPVRQERARRGKWGNFYDPSSRERKALAMELLAIRQGAKLSPMSKEVRLKVIFSIAPQKGRKSDLSNYLKAFEDSGNRVLWNDDAQIAEIQAELVRDSNNPRTEFWIEELN
jgi:Holliday junction resolvase RusA-like endonuclease